MLIRCSVDRHDEYYINVEAILCLHKHHHLDNDTYDLTAELKCKPTSVRILYEESEDTVDRRIKQIERDMDKKR